jgi:hypothetical protein
MYMCWYALLHVSCYCNSCQLAVALTMLATAVLVSPV